MHESQIQAAPYDVELTPNGLISIVRGNSSATPIGSGSDQRVSFWRTDVTAGAQLFPNVSNAVGRGGVTLSNGVATFSNAIAANNERAVIIGSADTNFDSIEETTYVDIVAFDYTQTPPTVTVLATYALAGAGNTPAGYAHDVAITPDGVLAVVTSANWIHVFELMTGGVVKAFNVGGPDSPAGAGPCLPGFSRNSLEVTNDHAVVTMARTIPSFPTNSATWVYVVDLSYSPPTTLPSLVLEDEPFSSNNNQRKPHDLAISPDGTRAGISSYNLFALYDLAAATPAFLGGQFNGNRWKETLDCSPIWDSIEMSDTRAVVLSDRPQVAPSYPCEWKYWWTAEVFTTVTSAAGPPATLLATFDDSPVFPNTSQYPGSLAWDLAMSDDGKLVAVKNGSNEMILLDVDTTAPILLRLGGLGAPSGMPSSGGWGVYSQTGVDSLAFRMNDAALINRGFTTPSLPSNPSGGVHRWIAFGGMTGIYTVNGFLQRVTSSVRMYDLPQFLAGNPQSVVFVHQDPVQNTVIADLAPNGSQTEVLTRDTAPPNEVNPALGGRDWYRYNVQQDPAVQVGITFGGSGVCRGVDSLIQRRGVSVSIASDLQFTNLGYVHVVRTF